MSKPVAPTAFPVWGTAIDPADIATPPEAQQESGWIQTGSPATPQKIPYTWMNWKWTLDWNLFQYILDMLDWLDGQGAIPTGQMAMFAGSVAPAGHLLCDGSAVSRTTYSDLFSVIGTTWGVGDGSTTFNLPDMQGFVGVGYKSGDADFGALAGTGGEKKHALIEAELAAHTHTIPVEASGGGASYAAHYNTNVVPSTGATSSVGSGTAHNNLQPFKVVNYIIKY